MKKPEYLEDLLKTVSLWLAFGFVCFSALCYAGLLRPTSASMIREPSLMGHFFLLIGSIFAAVCFILWRIAARKRRLRSELLQCGTRIPGIIEMVYQKNTVRYDQRSPYVIQYRYTYQDTLHYGKSCFLWEKPKQAPGDAVTVYTDDLGNSTIVL